MKFFSVVLLFCFTFALPTSSIPALKKSEERIVKVSENKDNPFVIDVMRIAKAAETRAFMDTNVDPCHDFYEYACGNWVKIHSTDNQGKLTTGLFERMTEALDAKVQSVLTSTANSSHLTDVDMKVKHFYESCTKIEILNNAYKANLVEIVAEFGEMPVLRGDKWNEKQFDWVEAIAKISYKYGEDIIIGMDLMADFADNTVNRVYIGHPQFFLESRSMYLDASNAIYRNGYRAKIKKELNRYLGVDEILAEKTAKEIVDFEIALAHGMVDETLGLGIDELSVSLTVDEMHVKYAPTIDVRKLVNISLGELVKEPVYEFIEHYQKNLMDVIKVTPKYQVANYIFYMLLEDFLWNPQTNEKKRMQACIDKTKSYFAKNLDNMVYRQFDTKETERDVNLIWNELKNGFKEELSSHELDWIELETREYAIEKLKAMKLEINSYASHNFTEEFGELVINKDNFIENIKNIRKLSTRQGIAELHKPPKPLDEAEVLSYTPANIILENTIKVPVSMLQPYYLWSSVYPMALKFGTLASLIGHELIHGFDDNGRKFDKDGNSKNWWDDQSTDSFVERTKCFTDQYSKYSYGGQQLTESVSQSENIADNAGIRLAYNAYLKWYENTVRSGQSIKYETLPNLEQTNKQLFFTSYAQIWCNDVHPKVKRLQASIDSHMPGKFRVIGTLSNFAEFSKEFNCETGSIMNPLKKCKIY